MRNNTQKIKLLALWDILKRIKKTHDEQMFVCSPYNRIDIRSSIEP